LIQGKKTNDISGDLVYATHHHSDHTAGVEPFLKTNPEAKFVCSEQVADKFKKFRERIIPAMPGEEILEGHWKLKFIKGRHGLENWQYCFSFFSLHCANGWRRN
jgi:metal-dependent hydrolase (beta-lactamase superfamily II)